MKVIIKLQFAIFLISFTPAIYCQNVNINSGMDISDLSGNEINPSWSYDGKNLLFQSSDGENINLYIYKVEADTLLYISDSSYNFSNPVWFPDGSKIVFDSDKSGPDYLYTIDVVTLEITPLFNRNIRCRDACFSTSVRQVYFTGWDEFNKRWEIYSYDFVYDNINKLTNNKYGCSDADVSADGKLVAYCRLNHTADTKNIEVINWYGDAVIEFNDFEGQYPSWSPSGFKLLFVSNIDDSKGELYSIWKDGSHLKRLTNDKFKVMSAVVSPDAIKIALSVYTPKGWDIFIVPFDE